MTTNSQLSTTELKKKKKNKLSKQLEQEQNQRNRHHMEKNIQFFHKSIRKNQRNGDHMENYQQGGDRRRMGEKV